MCIFFFCFPEKDQKFKLLKPDGNFFTNSYAQNFSGSLNSSVGLKLWNVVT